MAGNTCRTAQLTLLALALACTSAAAQSFEVVVDFGDPSGQQPKGELVEARDGCLYGTTVAGGADGGTIYRVCDGVNTTVYTFVGERDGSSPEAGLALGNDGVLYGVARMGGTANMGTIFRFVPGTRQFATLFTFTGANGSQPRAELSEGTDGRLYGTTSMGGASSMGTVFSIEKSGAGFKLLASFNNTNGRTPAARLLQASDGFWYGTTASGGSAGVGTIFRVGASGGLTTIHSFTGANGSGPRAGLTLGADGAMYGVASSGGATGQGVLFKIDTAGRFTLLRSFAGSNGATPYSELVRGSDGSFYGATMFGGASALGVVFKADVAGNITVLRSLTELDGGRPEGALVEAYNGRLYGAAPTGGPAGSAGTVFEITTTGAFTRVSTFSGTPAVPYAPLVRAQDGSLYGISFRGGTSGNGTIFQLRPGISLDVLHSFSGVEDGSAPYDGFSEGANGSLYGATTSGGPSSGGTAFKYNPASGFSLLASFTTAAGVAPYSSPVLAADGNYYGVTSTGGAAQAGTIYRLTAAGVLSTVHVFNGTNGKTPYGRLIAAKDGLLYGTTTSGGGAQAGTLFSYDPVARVFRNLHAFSTASGLHPYAGLLEGSDGRLYGVTYRGGATDQGSVFVFDPQSGAVTRLYSFTTSSGIYPYAPLMEGADGRLFGTTSYGTSANRGSVFAIQKTGAGFTLLHAFKGADGAYPRAGLVAGADGYLYGTAPGGGSVNNGVIFRVDPKAEPEPTPGTVTVTYPNTVVNLGIGTTRIIKWNHTFGTGSTAKVELSRDGGQTWNVIANAVANGPTTGSTPWVVSGPATTQARIRVSSPDGAVSDISNVNFTIANPYVRMTTPNVSTAVWTIGTSAAIKWAQNLGTAEKVKLELSLDGGVTYPVVLASATPSDGAFTTTVSAAWASTLAKVRVSWVKDGTVVDVSDAQFTVK